MALQDKPKPDEETSDRSELLQAVIDSIFKSNSQTIGAGGPELFVANQPGTIIPEEPGGAGPADPPGNPEAVNVTNTDDSNFALGLEAALSVLGGPLQGSLLGAVTSGKLGMFGVVGGSLAPAVGSADFAATVAAGQETSDLADKAEGIAGHSAISEALNDDFGDDFGGFGDSSAPGDTPGDPGGGGQDSGAGGSEGPGGSGNSGGPGGGGGGSGGTGEGAGRGDSGPGGFAHGGRPPVGVPVLVGEGGPEQFVPDAAGIGDQIIRQAGIEAIAEMLRGGGDEKENKEKKASPKTKKAESSPTQKTEKPVQKAAEEREAGRSDIEQLFLDLLTGKINVGPEMTDMERAQAIINHRAITNPDAFK